MLTSLCIAGAVAATPWPASDWIATGLDCRIFAAGDINGDGFVDLITINGARDLCVAPTVHGWKAAGWRAIANDVNPSATHIAVERTSPPRIVITEPDRMVIFPLKPDGTTGERIIEPLAAPAATVAAPSPAESLTPPPYDSEARDVLRFESTFAEGRGRVVWTVFETRRPHPHRIVRMAVVESGDPSDTDADGLTDSDESALGTDLRDRDSDGDGLLDGWEVHGFPRERLADLGPRIQLYQSDATADERDRQLNPRRRDVIVNVSYFEQVDPKQFEGEMPRVQAVYRDLLIRNPDGSTGVWVHFRDHGPKVPPADQHMPWWDVGNKYFARSERGLLHWMQVTPWGGGQSAQTGDMGGCGNGWAVFAHEFGHQLSLSHTGDSAPGWCPLYPSLMNYAYSYSFDGDWSKPHFSSGEFRDIVLDERNLQEKLPFAFERVKFLANHPFRFTLKDNGDGATLIDWNHNGVFDAQPVIADINYGGSTQAGERRTHALIGSAPSLAYVGSQCIIAAATHKQTAVTLKASLGGEQWSGHLELPSSATRFDPVLIGGADWGVVLVRRFDGWAAAKVRNGGASDAPPASDTLAPLTGVDACDLSGLRVEDRVLLIARHDDGRTAWVWLTFANGPQLSVWKPLALTSMVPPALAVDPGDGTITVISSAQHPQHGPFCMQFSTLRVVGDDIIETPAAWTHNGRLVHCTSRPVAVYPAGSKPQLTIFHTGWADGGGTWTGWRTTRVGNASLDDGWLTCQLYDEWTRSRVALGFADGAQGAYYAFRWDPGDHHDWKINTMFVARGGYGIDDQPMRDFDDGAQIGLWGIRHSILTMPTDSELQLAR